jgi:hypothetical protein
VQNIESVLMREMRQNRLMPQYVFDGWAKPFGHEDDLHFLFGEIEQRQIFFEHEKNELVFTRVRQKRAQQGEQILRNSGLAALDYRSGNADPHLIHFCHIGITPG